MKIRKGPHDRWNHAALGEWSCGEHDLPRPADFGRSTTTSWPTVVALRLTESRCLAKSTSSTCSPAISPHLSPHRPSTSTIVRRSPDSSASRNSCSTVRYVCPLRFLRGVSMPSHGLDGMSLSDAASAQMPRRIPRLRSTTVALLLSAWVLTYSWISARVSDSSVRAPHCGSTWTRHARLIDST